MVFIGKSKDLTWGSIEEGKDRNSALRIDTRIQLVGLFPHKFGSGQKYLSTTYFGFHTFLQTTPEP